MAKYASLAYEQLQKTRGDCLTIADFKEVTDSSDFFRCYVAVGTTRMEFEHSRQLRRQYFQDFYLSVKETALTAVINLSFYSPNLFIALCPIIILSMAFLLFASVLAWIGNCADIMKDYCCSGRCENECPGWKAIGYIVMTLFYVLSCAFAFVALAILICTVVTRLTLTKDTKYYMNYRYHLLNSDAEILEIKWNSDAKMKDAQVLFSAQHFAKCLKIEEEMHNEGIYLKNFKVFGVGIRTRPKSILYSGQVVKAASGIALLEVKNELTGDLYGTQAKSGVQPCPTTDSNAHNHNNDNLPPITEGNEATPV